MSLTTCLNESLSMVLKSVRLPGLKVPVALVLSLTKASFHSVAGPSMVRSV